MTEVFLDNEKFRIDSEFFLKKYLNAYNKIKSKPNISLNNIISTLSDFSANGSYASIAENFKLLDNPDYAYMVRSVDLENSNFIDNVKYVDKHAYEFLGKSKLFGGEVLINKIGSPGRVYLMPKLNKHVSLGMNLFVITLNEKENITQKFLWIYLNTVLGQKIIRRKINGTVPLTIDKAAIKSLYIPIFSKIFITSVEKLIDSHELKIENSQNRYTQAETLLLETLGLQDFQPSKEAVNVKTLQESFIASGRLDAEYYQPKYEELEKRITALKYKKLGAIVRIQKSIEPGSAAYQEEGIPFVRVSNLSKMGISAPEIHLDATEFKDVIRPKKDTILLSKDGSVGIAYKVSEDLNCITSSAILHLTVKDKDVLPDYLTLMLNSIAVKMQSERDAGGSIIQHWKPSEIEEVVIPIIDISIQEQIATLIQESFALKAESEHLLATAKRAVEIAIEESEEEAMAFINENS